MKTGKDILGQLARRRGGPVWRSLLAGFLRGLSIAILFLPLAAFFYRMEFGRPEGVGALVRFFLLFLTLPLIGSAIYWLLRRRPTMAMARDADRELGGGERLLTAVDLQTHRREGPLVPLVLQDAARALSRLSPKSAKGPRLRWPSPTRALVALLLALLILLVPAARSGRLGPASDTSRSPVRGAADDLIKGEEEAGGEEASAGDFHGKVALRAETDARMYALGQEINLSLEMKTLEPLPKGVPLKAVLILDGSARLELPLDWTLPSEPESRLEARWALKERLKEIDHYDKGLMSIEAYVYSAIARDDLKGPAAANRLLIQISENQENLQSKVPKQTKPKKQPQKKPKQKRPEKERPNRPPQKKKKPEARKPAPQGQTPPPPKDLKTVEHVIEPLFAGDQRTKRKTRVFDRDVEDAPDLPPEVKKKVKDRAYDRAEEVDFKRMPLGGRERALVRRYLDGLRSGGGGAKKK